MASIGLSDASGTPPRLRVMRVIARMNVGGPARQICALMQRLDPERFEQRLCTGAVGPDEADHLVHCAPEVEAVRLPHLGRSVRPTDDLRALAELTAAMRRFRPHLVHTHTAKAGALGRLAAECAGVPARVHTFHGHLLHGYFTPGRTRLVAGVERLLARRCDRLVAVGTRVRDELLAAGVGRPGQYAVVPPGVDPAPPPARAWARTELGLPPEGPVVAYVGRLAGIKRPDRLLQLARQVRRTVPAARFLVCGEGEGRSLLAAADDAGLHLLGWRADVGTVYAAADVVVLTSDNEGAPVSLIEAGLAGVPVVAPWVGSVPEVVEDGETGLLAAPDHRQLAAHTVRLLGDDALRRRMGAAASVRTAQRFGAERLVAETEELYTALALDRRWWSTTGTKGGRPCTSW